jgi:hypothetical protein
LISPVADVIEARNRPFIFATGYGMQGLPPEYRDRPVLQKPFQMENLAGLRGDAVAKLLQHVRNHHADHDLVLDEEYRATGWLRWHHEEFRCLPMPNSRHKVANCAAERNAARSSLAAKMK